LSFLKLLFSDLGRALAFYGGWGLFAMSFLDSSFIPFPGFNDLALIILASRHPGRWPYYALMSIVGSLLGSYITYGIGRAGRKLTSGKSTATKERQARRWLEENDFVAMLVACLLPPPAPLKIFVIAAGALRMNPLRFGAALLVGRSLRFAAEAWLGVHYGPLAEAYLKKNLTWASLVTILIVIAWACLSRWRKRERATGSGDSG
jgi:membrane protein YqaA with SNARE-associated domain